MNTILKVAGALIFALGLLLIFILPPVSEKVGDALKYNIRQNYATPEIIASESPRYLEMHKRYEEGLVSLIESRTNFAYVTSLLIALFGVSLCFARRNNPK